MALTIMGHAGLADLDVKTYNRKPVLGTILLRINIGGSKGVKS